MPDKSNTANPFSGMGDPFEMMQKMWGMAGMPTPGNLASLVRAPQQMPSMLAPTIDIGELDKRIADLRAVEQWLELNASMLRTTIQTLEVQRATIATLKSISGAMMAPLMGPPPPQRSPFPPIPPEFSSPAAAATMVPPPESAAEAKPARPRRKVASHTPSLSDDALNPAAWWHTLQDQFSKIAAAASETAQAEAKTPARKAKRARRKAKR
ncbi:MAG TPA: PhaM family polyhydroxyalkanoate granule multifunctional regulatory protein [Burkholderiaceae bacterium]|nr:PhaM family polyhydroxyalkanoate granule multifunctional regulatory protein [Burkholderiaceae bacterium]